MKIGRGNIGRGKNTRQSSTGYGGLSSRAVDGNSNSQWRGRSCTHTNRQRNAWWRVDLGADYKVGMVKLTNRGDCCGNRLSNFDIRVGSVDGNPKANGLYVFTTDLFLIVGCSEFSTILVPRRSFVLIRNTLECFSFLTPVWTYAQMLWPNVTLKLPSFNLLWMMTDKAIPRHSTFIST